jgi:3-phosphoshikimate 1-carboxyvinyltransferase
MTKKYSTSILQGTIQAPRSKSHTIRALCIASLAKGKSTINFPLISSDTASCIVACKALGATIKSEADSITVNGTGGKIAAGKKTIDVGNSGTTLAFFAALFALGGGPTRFLGDEQIANRSMGNLLHSLRDLGVVVHEEAKDGCVPFSIAGSMQGGKTTIDCPTSQYLSSLLLAVPLSAGATEITVLNLNEKPYVEMTLVWLRRQGIKYKFKNFSNFTIEGKQHYRAFEQTIPGDFSSASFFLCGSAITGGTVTVKGLSMDDSQGDKDVVGLLSTMGATVKIQKGSVGIMGGELRGKTIDMNAIPDALPIMAVTACFAKGETRLINCPQARIKETDRIRVMAEELSKMGASIQEMPDGLVIQGSTLHGAVLESRKDHRVAMALSIAALGAKGKTIIKDAECVSVTVPEFYSLLDSLCKK